MMMHPPKVMATELELSELVRKGYSLSLKMKMKIGVGLKQKLAGRDENL